MLRKIHQRLKIAKRAFWSVAIVASGPIEFVTPDRIALKRIIPNQIVEATYEVKNISDNFVVLVPQTTPRECNLDYDPTPIKPAEKSTFIMSCIFPKSDTYRSITGSIVASTATKDSYYEFRLSGRVEYKDTFNEIANTIYRKYQNSMTVHIHRPPTEIDWKGPPRSVLMDLANNQYLQNHRSKMPIGHVTIELNCMAPDGTILSRVGGQGLKSMNDFSKKILEEGYGFSVILQPKDQKDQLLDYPLLTVAGRFETPSQIFHNNDQGIWEHDLMGFATFLVHPQECEEMVEFFDAYVSKTVETQTLAGNVYGFGADPNLFQGAGCATFVEAFFQRSSIEFYPKFYHQQVHIPLSLFGNPSSGKYVNIADLFSDNQYLGLEGPQTVSLSFPDPDVLYKTVKRAYEGTKFPGGIRVVEAGKFGNSKAIYSIFDARECNHRICI
jgi:hypothetical protein